MKIPKSIYTIKSNITFVVCLVAFVMLFAITYTPTYGLAEEADDLTVGAKAVTLWYDHQGLCLSICCAIILGTVAISRTLLLLTTRNARIHEGEYFLWQLAEVAVTGLFCNLFLSLYFHFAYFHLMPLTLLIYISVAIFPYSIYWLLIERIDRDLRIAAAQRTIMELRHGNDTLGSNTLRFVDDKGNVKLIVSVDRVVYIESAGNYVTILYENNHRMVRYSLRNTLKNIEELCASHSLVRCHRSYYINLHRVKLLRKEHDGIYAEIDAEGVNDIPVSKSYAPEVMQRFSSLQ
jgi:hypothetical protein